MAIKDKTVAPRGESLIRIVNKNIVKNLMEGQNADIELPPLIERAFLITYETGNITYRDYFADEDLLIERQ